MANELLKTQPKADGAGAGGWVPGKKTPAWVAVVVGSLTTSAPAIGLAVAEWNVKAGFAVGAVLLGLAASLGTYFGMRSAGPRAP